MGEASIGVEEGSRLLLWVEAAGDGYAPESWPSWKGLFPPPSQTDLMEALTSGLANGWMYGIIGERGRHALNKVARKTLATCYDVKMVEYLSSIYL